MLQSIRDKMARDGIFFMIENLLSKSCDPNVEGKNDITNTFLMALII